MKKLCMNCKYFRRFKNADENIVRLKNKIEQEEIWKNGNFFQRYKHNPYRLLFAVEALDEYINKGMCTALPKKVEKDMNDSCSLFKGLEA